MKSLSYAFMLNVWMMKKVDEPFIRLQDYNGRLTQDEVTMIMVTPQND